MTKPKIVRCGPFCVQRIGAFPVTLNADEVNAVLLAGLPAVEELGLRVERIEPDGRVWVRQPFRPNQLRPGGTVSGPTMMGLADAAMYAAVLARLGRVEMAVTQSLTINFFRRPAPRDLLAVAEILKPGKRSMVLEVRLFSEGEESMVAHVTGTYALPPGHPDATGQTR